MKLIKYATYTFEYRIIGDFFSDNRAAIYDGRLRSGLHAFTYLDGSEVFIRNVKRDLRNVVEVSR